MRRFVALAMTVFGTILGLFVISAPAVFAKPACVCTCTPEWNPIAQWANYTQGNTDCRADCAQACGGAANLQDPATGGRLVDVACIPGSNDCRTGAFSIYEGVSCVLQYDTGNQNALNTWPETSGQKPVCIVPLTPKNANAECQQYGGAARGGTCGRVEDGTDPNTYDKSRPSLGGTAPTRDYTGSYTLASWRAQGDFQAVSYASLPATAGICQRYGVRFGGAPMYEGFDPGPNGENVSGVTPFYDYVCLKPKRNQCGTVARPFQQGVDVPLNASAYSCQRTQDLIARGQPVNTFCWGNDATLCGASPGTRCCLGGTGGTGQCNNNSDCGNGKYCNASGNCVTNPVCDPLNNDTLGSFQSTPWMVDQRRCRFASEIEKADPEICTVPLVSGSPSACENPGQTCCRAANPYLVSGCAADYAKEAGSSSIFNDFTCVDVKDIPASQLNPMTGTIATLNGDAKQWNVYNSAGNGPHCLGTTVVKRDANGRVTGTVARCGSQSFCCNATALRRLGSSTPPLVRAASGQACGNATSQAAGFRCLNMNQVLPTEQEALDQFGLTRDEYLAQLANGKCQITPLDANVLYSTKECEAQTFCCSPTVVGATACKTDADCGSSALKCDLSISACVDANLVNAALNSASCFTRAQSQGANIQSIANTNQISNTDLFTCQVVNASAQDVSGKCVPAGCDNVGIPPGSGQGATMQCCVPGTGQTPGAAAAAPAASIPAPPFGLTLPACIQKGNCQLTDIVATGAMFANFLLRIVGAVFLGIFVWGGFKYLTSGASGRAAEAKKMIIQATIAMVLIMIAFVFVNFVQQSLIGGRNPGQSEQCSVLSTPDKAYACQFLAAPPGDSRAISEEITRRGCERSKCPGPANYVCCPQ